MRTVPRPIRLLLALAVLGGLLAVLSGCGTSSADKARGRVLFNARCGTCHVLAQAASVGQQGPNLDDAFAASREIGQSSSTIEEVVKSQVENPRPENGDPAVSMPAGLADGQDLDDIAAYVGSVAGVPGIKPPEVEGGPGAQVFANNGCGSCHTLEAAKSAGVTGPNLDEVLPDQDSAMIEEDIVDPEAEIAAGYPPKVMPANFGETIPKAELESLVEYLVESTGAKK